MRRDSARGRGDHRRFLAPEVIQTSMMDCGPAALKSILQGFGIEVRYEELRERCQTDVDGTSIDHLAALSRELGLATDEMVVPEDSFLLAEAACLPAIAIVRAPNRAWHFVVVWRAVGSWVLVMDPAGGRRWTKKGAFLRGLPKFTTPISADRWRAWAASEDALLPLRAKMRRLGVGHAHAAALTAIADTDPTWVGFAALDAAVRMARHLEAGGALRRGREARALIQRLLEGVIADPRAARQIIPHTFWWAAPSPSAGAGKVVVSGPLIVHFRREGGRAAVPVASVAGATASDAPDDPTLRWTRVPSFVDARETRTERALSEHLRDALDQPRVSPLRLLLELVRADAPRAIAPLLGALVLSSAVATIEVFLLRSILDADQYLALSPQRAAAALALVLFALGGVLVDVSVARILARLGMTLEMRFRAAFLEKLPRLEDRYLRSRPTSDMTSRAHAMHVLRDAPLLGARIVRALLALAFALGVVVWLHPRGVGLALASAASTMVVSYVLRSVLAESTARRRALGAGLEQFYLDALRGVVPIRVHGAERAVRREHEELLVTWARAGQAVHGQMTLLQACQLVMGTATTLALVAGFVSSGQGLAHLLVFVLFVTRLPSSGQELAGALTDWLSTKNVALRLFAPLSASEAVVEAPPFRSARGARGAHLQLSGVTVREGGHALLQGVTVDVAGGSLVAIVGTSGAGKSSLLGLLLGWLSAAEGEVRVDGRRLEGDALVQLRLQTAWADPGIYLWNRTLLDNVAYGASEDTFARMAEVTTSSDLVDVLEHLPDGLQTPLGEGGTRVSAGQGQRVRLARAMMRTDARLVLLDEPFRGLDRAQRRKLLSRARAHWRDATILFVSHDVSDTTMCDRVLVVDGGKIVEDGVPSLLMERKSSRFAALARADADLRRTAWSASAWSRKRLDDGRLVSAPSPPIARRA